MRHQRARKAKQSMREMYCGEVDTEVTLDESLSMATRALELSERAMAAAKTILDDTDVTPEKEQRYLTQVAELEEKLEELRAVESRIAV